MPADCDPPPDKNPNSMKKIILLLIAALFSFSCSIGQFIPILATPTPFPTATETFTPEPTATHTEPAPPTPTFTLTPTLVGFKSPTPTPSITETPEFTPTQPTATDLPTLTATVQMQGFVFVSNSVSEFYKGTQCEPSTVKITAQVFDQNAVKYVLLFARFKSLTSQRASKWTNISMGTIGAGTFIHDLSSDQMLEDAYFQTSWVEYQIVATTASGKEIGRTDIFKEKIKMLECVPTPTSLPATVKP